MGAQPWFIDRGGKKIPWDEAKTVSEETYNVQDLGNISTGVLKLMPR